MKVPEPLQELGGNAEDPGEFGGPGPRPTEQRFVVRIGRTERGRDVGAGLRRWNRQPFTIRRRFRWRTRMPGAGIEPARDFSQGILSRKPSPRIPRLHSERHRRQPLRSAGFRRKSDTATDTGGEGDDDSNPGKQAPALPPLGKNTKKPSTPVADPEENARRTRRKARYSLRDVLHEYSSLPRVALCGRLPIKRDEGPEIRCQVNEGGSRYAHFAKVQLCSRVWACPVCGPRIQATRAADLDAACSKWIEEHGTGSVMLLTLTLPHDFGQRLAELLSTVRHSFSILVSGQRWQEDKDRFSLRHWVRAHDVTVGPNGWHPHLHIVLFEARALPPDELATLEERLFNRWAVAVRHRGNRRPSREHGISLEQARSRSDVSRYVCQVVTGEKRLIPVAWEVARGDLKTSSHQEHRTPWQVLGDFKESGDTADLRLWHEWERTTRNVHAIRWSNGLRAAVDLRKELSDEEIVAVAIGGEVLYVFSGYEWRVLTRTRGAMHAVLCAAEHGGSDAVAAFMRELMGRLSQTKGTKLSI